MASDGLGKTMEETAEELAGAESNYAPVVGAGLWEQPASARSPVTTSHQLQQVGGYTCM